MMKKKMLNLLLGSGLLGLAAPAKAADRPNVILIMADDLGYETIGANGGTSYRTPVLDRLAAGGVRFRHCYVQPLCTPTRVQMMTGAYNVRNYITFGTMNPILTTFGNLFKRAGYVTGITGKWQLGRFGNLPKQFGFDEACLWQHLRRPPRYANPGLEINGVPKDYKNGEYGPKLVNDYALDFIERHRDRPFFLYYPMILTHAPYQPTPDSPDYDPKAIGERVNKHVRHFGEMVEYTDKMVGRVVARLDELGLRERTLLIFLGDNGTGAGTPSMMGDRRVVGGKGRTTAAGMHVPLIVSWPGHIARGAVCNDLVDSTDFLPTICATAGVEVPDRLTVDGRSFLPQLRGAPGQPREWVYCWYSPRLEPLQEMAFDQHYKLHRDGRFLRIDESGGETPVAPGAALSPEAAAAKRKLQAALDRYAHARPAHLPKPGSKVKAKARNKRQQRQ